MRFGHLTSKFEGRDRLLAADRWETIEKLVEGVAGFQVVVEGLHGNARPHEYWCTTENVWIAVNDRGSVGHGFVSGSLSIRPALTVAWLTVYGVDRKGALAAYHGQVLTVPITRICNEAGMIAR